VPARNRFLKIVRTHFDVKHLGPPSRNSKSGLRYSIGCARNFVIIGQVVFASSELEIKIKRRRSSLRRFVPTTDIQIGDSALFAITHDNIRLLDRLLEHEEKNGDNGTATKGAVDVGTADDSYEFPQFMTPLMLAAQCGRYEMVEYLLGRGHKLNRPHPPRCTCEERCSAAAMRDRDAVADGCERLNVYRAISDPTYVCCTSAADPILVCFKLHNELLECGSIDQMYMTKYMSMAQQVTSLKRIPAAKRYKLSTLLLQVQGDE